MQPDLLTKLNKLSDSQRANLALSLMLEKGLITPDDIREALKPAMHCKICDFITAVCETTEQAERLMMAHMHAHHPEYVEQVSEKFILEGP
jgi:ABC-type thiamine transport system ATPase subunit